MSDNQIPPVASSQEPTKVKVRIGDSALIFGNELTISLNQTSYEGSPARCKVFATLLSPGYQEMRIKRAEVGFACTYKAKINYDIQLLTADATTAEFLISPKSE